MMPLNWDIESLWLLESCICIPIVNCYFHYNSHTHKWKHLAHSECIRLPFCFLHSAYFLYIHVRWRGDLLLIHIVMLSTRVHDLCSTTTSACTTRQSTVEVTVVMCQHDVYSEFNECATVCSVDSILIMPSITILCLHVAYVCTHSSLVHLLTARLNL